ncbi:ATP-binding protein [Shewanella sp. SR43-4]|jgi:serine/threonine-protein kinase RsbW|uniref:ATP-binding protein n=1 Tax=Shewanella vesiculosa TaxID=518738 RepID=A0ABV0FQM0_9GAMM|nr:MULTISPECIES: ATP-binding protein [Shewanella]NCQ45112.1 ATP-binding protein [Shewanella frigidimarina]MBB1316453.1 ATP-binding protein [Shewanella sp. SR43-4]MBB1323195.1 ATP-binding protein [Shewanella sp. SR43-8]MBB1475581.1 ATP-binding protein [Shewanella sp. SG41-3]NCO70900.1 ATP-binding protein [Shewanella vesiculosa]|tara:strand:+ start:2454 stop:2855 length:402 start_codon:yes stop_codon:yes gene_type:complete
MSNIKTFSSCTSELKNIRQFVEHACQDFPFREDKVNEIVLAVDEACANVIRHGYHMSKKGCLEIEISSDHEHARFVIKDVCSQITDKQLIPPENNLCEPGGLGLCLIHYVAETVRLLPHKGKGNWLELTVKFE